jgi:hypothetical protein
MTDLVSVDKAVLFELLDSLDVEELIEVLVLRLADEDEAAVAAEVARSLSESGGAVAAASDGMAAELSDDFESIVALIAEKAPGIAAKFGALVALEERESSPASLPS